MPKLIKLETNKTYATAENAQKAVEKKYGADANDGLRYFIQRTDDGRCFPVFIGQGALQRMVHFHFNVVL